MGMGFSGVSDMGIGKYIRCIFIALFLPIVLIMVAIMMPVIAVCDTYRKRKEFNS